MTLGHWMGWGMHMKWRAWLGASLAMVLAVSMVAAASAEDPAQQLRGCVGHSEGDLWQQALEIAPGKPSLDNSAASCADPTRVQEAGGCCTGHGGPAGCDPETHKVLCADGKKSKSCEC